MLQHRLITFFCVQNVGLRSLEEEKINMDAPEKRCGLEGSTDTAFKKPLNVNVPVCNDTV